MQRIYNTLEIAGATYLAGLLAGGNVKTIQDSWSGLTIYEVWCFTAVPSDSIQPAIQKMWDHFKAQS